MKQPCWQRGLRSIWRPVVELVIVLAISSTIFGGGAIAQGSDGEDLAALGEDEFGRRLADIVVDLVDTTVEMREIKMRIAPLAQQFYGRNIERLDNFMTTMEPGGFSRDFIRFIAAYRSEELRIILSLIAQGDLGVSKVRTPFATAALARIVKSARQVAAARFDWNGFWIADISGLNRLLDQGSPIGVLESEIAKADASPLGSFDQLAPPFETPVPHFDYVFRVLTTEQRATGQRVVIEGLRGPALGSALAVCARPVADPDGATLILRVEIAPSGKLALEFYGKHSQDVCGDEWPDDPKAVGWKLLLIDSFIYPPRPGSALYRSPALGLQAANLFVKIDDYQAEKSVEGSPTDSDGFVQSARAELAEILGTYYELDKRDASDASTSSETMEELITKFRPDRTDLLE